MRSYLEFVLRSNCRMLYSKRILFLLPRLSIPVFSKAFHTVYRTLIVLNIVSNLIFGSTAKALPRNSDDQFICIFAPFICMQFDFDLLLCCLFSIIIVSNVGIRNHFVV